VISSYDRFSHPGHPKTFLDQGIRFIIVGVFTAGIDLALLVFLVEYVQMNYLIAAAIGFLTGSTSNYLLSILWVFYRGRYRNVFFEYITFTLLTCVGLGINQVTLYLGVLYIHIYYIYIKLFSLILVTLFNFMTKKFIVFIH
jgi:putative flippase GtrA